MNILGGTGIALQLKRWSWESKETKVTGVYRGEYGEEQVFTESSSGLQMVHQVCSELWAISVCREMTQDSWEILNEIRGNSTQEETIPPKRKTKKTPLPPHLYMYSSSHLLSDMNEAAAKPIWTFNPYDSIQLVLFKSPFNRWLNKVSERPGVLPKFTQPIKSRAGIFKALFLDKKLSGGREDINIWELGSFSGAQKSQSFSSLPLQRSLPSLLSLASPTCPHVPVSAIASSLPAEEAIY